MVKGDKSTIFYSVEKERYSEILQNNITVEYKKTPENQAKIVKESDSRLAKKLNIEERVETLPKTEAYFTFKDHNSNFENRQTVKIIKDITTFISFDITSGLLDKASGQDRGRKEYPHSRSHKKSSSTEYQDFLMCS